MLKIVQSNSETPVDIINKIINIEENVYEPKYRGTFDSISNRFNKFKEMFILAYVNNLLVGYVCFFPISDTLYNDILYSDGFYDDDIKAIDIECYRNVNHIYIISIAVLNDYQKQHIGTNMMSYLFDTLHTKSSECTNVDILTSVISSNGKLIVEKFGFTLVKDLLIEEGYNLYLKVL